MLAALGNDQVPQNAASGCFLLSCPLAGHCSSVECWVKLWMRTHILSPRACPRIWPYSLPIYRCRILKSLFQKLRLSIPPLLELWEYVYQSRCLPCEAYHVSYPLPFSLLFMFLLPCQEWCLGGSSENWEVPRVWGTPSHLYAMSHWDDPRLCITRPWCERTYMPMQINVTFLFVLAAPLHLSGYLCHS